MLNQVEKQPVTEVLSDDAQTAYRKIKALIMRIFALLKRQEKEENLKEEFYDSYIEFSRKLKSEGYDKECYNFMAICEMYYDLMDNPDELINQESFFKDLFNAFDELLSVRINYDEKYNEFLMYTTKMQEHYYLNFAVPSPYYDEDVCNDIISKLASG